MASLTTARAATGSARNVRYELTPLDWRQSWQASVALVEHLVVSTGARRVCELGGGAYPALSQQFVRENELDLLLIDISADELDKTPAGYRTLAADLADPSFDPPGVFDLVFSLMVAEHVADAAAFHRNALRLLAPGGRAVHVFPTLYSLPFLVNRLLPEAVSGRLLGRLESGRDRAGVHGKFPAYYRWCRGPSRRQLARLEGVGFEVEEYVGFFGHRYLRRVPPLQRLEFRAAALLARHPLPQLTSYASVVLRRPPERPSESTLLGAVAERLPRH